MTAAELTRLYEDVLATIEVTRAASDQDAAAAIVQRLITAAHERNGDDEPSIATMITAIVSFLTTMAGIAERHSDKDLPSLGIRFVVSVGVMAASDMMTMRERGEATIQ